LRHSTLYDAMNRSGCRGHRFAEEYTKVPNLRRCVEQVEWVSIKAPAVVELRGAQIARANSRALQDVEQGNCQA